MSVQHLIYQQCRVCYNSTKNLQLLSNCPQTCFSQESAKSYAHLLTEVCKINILEDEPLGLWPQFICDECSQKLQSAFEFIQETLKTNNLLKSIAAQVETKTAILYIEKPELDIPLEIKIEEEDVEVLPNDKVFHYSPVETNALNADTSLLPPDNCGDVFNNNNTFKDYQYKIIEADNENIKQIIIPSTIEFINNGLINNEEATSFYTNNKNNRNSYELKTNKTLTCTLCNKLFATIKKLRRHQRYTHMPEEDKVCCPVCYVKFAQNSHLKRHLQSVHKSYRNKVIMESKKPNKNSNKTKILTNIISCNECKKVFKCRKSLTRHKRIHIPEEHKIPCKFCGHRFARSDNYKQHLLRKHNIKNISLSQTSLRDIKQTRFFCDQCDRSYTRRFRLYKHKREVHGK